MQRKKLWMIRLIAVLLAVVMVVTLAMCTPLSRTLRATSLPDSALEPDSVPDAEASLGTRSVTRQVLTCGREEHRHSEACYDEGGNLICEKEEHVHTEDCYETVEVPLPDEPETTELVLDQTPGEQAPAGGNPERSRRPGGGRGRESGGLPRSRNAGARCALRRF